jgi:hypothetical protein
LSTVVSPDPKRVAAEAKVGGALRVISLPHGLMGLVDDHPCP